MADPITPRRDQLERILGTNDHLLIRQFERLFDRAGSESPTSIEETQIQVAVIESKANSTISSISGLQKNERRVLSISSNLNADYGNYSIIADATGGSITVTLPNAEYALGLTYGITKKDATANTVTVQGTGGQTIVGDASFILIADAEVINLVSDGSNWELLN